MKDIRGSRTKYCSKCMLAVDFIAENPELSEHVTKLVTLSKLVTKVRKTLDPSFITSEGFRMQLLYQLVDCILIKW